MDILCETYMLCCLEIWELITPDKLCLTIAGITSIKVFIIIECYGYFMQVLPVMSPRNIGADHFNLILKLPGVEPQVSDL